MILNFSGPSEIQISSQIGTSTSQHHSNLTVTSDYPAKEEKQPPARPAPPTPQPPHRPAPPKPQPPQVKPDTADFLNIHSGQKEVGEKKLKSDDSFDFFGMMEKQTEDFGDFLSGSGKVDENPQVSLFTRCCYNEGFSDSLGRDSETSFERELSLSRFENMWILT